MTTVNENQTMADQNRFFLTGSDFSELAVLESTMPNELNSTDQLDQPESVLRAANFKKLDLQAIESNLIKQQTMPKRLKKRHASLQYKQLPIERQSLEQLSQDSQDVIECQPKQQVDWVSYLPRLRKSLRGLHPKNLRGQIWPQQQRSITYNSGVVSPLAVKMPKKGDAKRQASIAKRVASPKYQFGSKVGATKVPITGESEPKSPVEIARQDTQASKEDIVRIGTQEGPVQPADNSKTFKKEQDHEHVFIMNEDEKVGKDDATTKYDQTFYQPNADQTFMKSPPSQFAASSRGNTFQTSQQRQFMSPRFTVGNIRNDNSVPFNQSFGGRENVGDYSQIIKMPTPVLSQYQDIKKQNQSSAMSKIASEVETLADNEFLHNRDLPLSTFSVHRTPLGSPLNQVGSSFKINYRPIYDAHSATRPKVTKQPTQLNINKITPKPIEKRSPKAVNNKTSNQQHRVFQNILTDSETMQLRSPAVENLQVVVNMKPNNRKQYHVVDRNQTQYNNGTLSKNTIGATSFAARNQAESPDGYQSPFSRHRPEGVSMQQKSPEQSAKEFQESVRKLYKQQSNEDAASETQHLASDYLNRVEQIRKETNIGKTKLTLTIQQQQSARASRQPSKTLEKNQTERQDIYAVEINSRQHYPEEMNDQGQYQRLLQRNSTGADQHLPLQNVLAQNSNLPSNSFKNTNRMGVESDGHQKQRFNISSEHELGVFAQGVVFYKGNKTDFAKQQLHQKKNQTQRGVVVKEKKLDLNDTARLQADQLLIEQSDANSGEVQPAPQEQRVGGKTPLVEIDTTAMKVDPINEELNDTEGRASPNTVNSSPRKPAIPPLNMDIITGPGEESDELTKELLAAQDSESQYNSPRTIIMNSRFQQQESGKNVLEDQGGQNKTEYQKQLKLHNEKSKHSKNNHNSLTLPQMNSSDIQRTTTLMEGEQAGRNDSPLDDSINLKARDKFFPNAKQNRYQTNDRHKNKSHVVQLEGIYVRRLNKDRGSIELNPLDEQILANRAGKRGSLFDEEKQMFSARKQSQPHTIRSPIRTRQLNLSSIPDSIRTEAIIKCSDTVGPKHKFRSISTRRTSEIDAVAMGKAKRVEDITTILNRVVRANCCLKPQHPEEFDVMKKAVGDGSEYFHKPSRKAFRIRLKFLQNNFLQGVTEDFMSIQNLERQVENTIITTPALFKQLEIEDAQEQSLMIRLFKRFYFNTIQTKYGYLKNVKDKVEISGRALCSELEINPKILPLSGVITVFSEDAMLNWLSFLKIMCLFLLQKDLLETRFEFMIKFLNLTDNHEDLDRSDYMQDRMQRFQFAKRGTVTSSVQTLVLWNKIRLELGKNRDEIFEIGTKGMINMYRAVKLLIDAGIQAEETFCFFDQLFDIC